MVSPSENILQNLVASSLLHDASKHQLEQIINTHPYYAAAHFLLAKKLYLLKEADTENALQKAALHFSNDLWLQYILGDIEENDTAENKIITQTDKPIIDKEARAVQDITVLEREEIETEEEEALSEENTEANDAVHEKLSSLLQQQAATFEKPVAAEAEIQMENTAYHRVDYFDSQGIKLDEEKANDKLGTQLKRFTDWLKQMKRVNANPADLGTDAAGEHQVQNIAEHSNEGGEIITETMAEVLIKQGKPEQAIQIYQKLSFINPAKSVYFAAKIEELKG